MVIGIGNVAVDVARILSKTVDELKNTDISEHALAVLAESKIKNVHLIGRRGPAQAAFTPQELKELGALADCEFVLDDPTVELNPESQAELDQPKASQARKLIKLLNEFAQRPAAPKSRELKLHFLKSPTELLGDGRLNQVILERNTLVGEPGKQKSRGTGETERLDCGVLFRSVGYRGTPIPGVPFHDEWGIVPNEEGRVIDDDQPVAGLYAAGWIKRGPSGIIGTNKPDSIATVKALLADMTSLEPCPNRDKGSVLEHLAEKGVKVVDYDAWKKIDAAEIAKGEEKDKPREKFVTVDEMLVAAGL
jgi:ferredoxin--NADP+ reductase